MTANDFDAAGALIVMATIYFAIGTFVCWLLLIKWNKKEGVLWVKLAILPFLPVIVAWVIVLALVSFPYWWIYPERHMNEIDFDGSDEEKRLLEEYREACARRSVFRGVAEKLNWLPDSRPPWPFPKDRNAK